MAARDVRPQLPTSRPATERQRRSESGGLRGRGTPTARLDPEIRRAQLVEAAITTFVGRDPSTVGVDEVAAEVGVSRSLVYAYFGDRAGLLAAVHAALLDRVDSAVGLTDADIDVLSGWRAEQALGDVVRRYLEFARDHDGEWQLLGTIGAMAYDAIRETRRRHTERIAEIWGGGPAGRLVACAVIGLVENGTREWREHPDVELDRAANILTRTGWTGLAQLGAPAHIA